MKKMIVIFLLFVNCLLQAQILTREEFEAKLEPTQKHFDGLVKTRIEYSKKEYSVGDDIDIVIHFEVNTEKNLENYQFVLLDYKKNAIHTLFTNRFNKLSEEQIESLINAITKDEEPLKFIESDPDLVINNENPKGKYHLKFKLTDKIPRARRYDKDYSFITRELLLKVFTVYKVYNNLTDYFGYYSDFKLRIEINENSTMSLSDYKEYQRNKNKNKRIPRLKKKAIDYDSMNNNKNEARDEAQWDYTVLAGQTTQVDVPNYITGVDYYHEDYFDSVTFHTNSTSQN
ncbi:MAG: hypothetical protein R6U84_09005, partial [Candidatus Cloacimonadales bacterium]